MIFQDPMTSLNPDHLASIEQLVEVLVQHKGVTRPGGGSGKSLACSMR